MTAKESFISGLLKPVHTCTIWALGIYTLVWGLWVASPFWGVFEHAQLFSTLGMMAPELFWGCFAVLCGVAIITSAIRQSVKSLMFGANIAWFHWMMIAGFYFVGDWHNTGGITSLCVALYAAYVWLNLKVNVKYRHVDEHDLTI